MSNEKPRNIDEYKKWLKDEHEIEISHEIRTYYDSVTTRIKYDLEQSDFWLQLGKYLEESNDTYLIQTGYALFIPDLKPTLYMKPFDSFLLKTFRKNVVENTLWPDEPDGGWIVSSNWYCRINDIVRTLLVVKYLDGVQFTIERLVSFCKQHGSECHFSLEAREEGYYAAHLYAEREFEIPKFTSWRTEKTNVSVEIQITTQLQEVIRRLLHKYYEDRRRTIKKDAKWQWDYRSDEFVTNYLGHILHYVEGMIMEIREKQRSETWKSNS